MENNMKSATSQEICRGHLKDPCSLLPYKTPASCNPPERAERAFVCCVLLFEFRGLGFRVLGLFQDFSFTID